MKGSAMKGERVTPRVPQALDSAAAYSWRLLVVAAAVVVLGVAVWRFQLIVIAVLVALLLVRVLLPAAGWLRRRGLRPLLATWVVFVLSLGVIVGLGFAIVPPAVREFRDLDDAVLQGLQDVRQWLVEGPLELTGEQIEDALSSVITAVKDGSSGLLAGVAGGTATAIEVLAMAVLAVVISFFFVKDGQRLWAGALNLVPAERVTAYRTAGARVWEAFGGYLVGAVVEGVVEATGVGIVLLIMGVPLVMPLMLLVFLAAFLPIVGPFVAGLVAALVALVNGGWVDGLVVAAAVVVVNQLCGNLLMPVVMGRTMHLHPVIVLLAIAAGSVLAGVAGAFLAVPVAGALIGALSALHGSLGRRADGTDGDAAAIVTPSD